MVDVVLVSMPFAPVERPSGALGLLQGMLERDGISTRSLYPCLDFGQRIGAIAVQELYRTRFQDGLVDWCFARVAFPELQADEDEYLETFLVRNDINYTDRAGFKAFWLSVRNDADAFIDQVLADVLALNPRIVGCTSTFQQNVASLALLRRLRETAPHIVTMMGGANCETIMGQTLHRNFPWVDYVVQGEAEDVVGPLCRALLADGRDVPPGRLPDYVSAPYHRTIGYPVDPSSQDGAPRHSAPVMKNHPVPIYDDYFSALRRLPMRDHVVISLPLETSRGCWWGQKKHCTFCGLNGGGMTFRSKGAPAVLAEIEALVERYGVRKFEVVDNILDLSYFDTLLPALEKMQPQCELFFETKSNLKKSQMEALRRAGVISLQPGIESLHSEVLTLMRKGVKGWQNVQFLRRARQLGIYVNWGILTGFPGEDDAWYQQMARWMPLLEHFQPTVVKSIRYDRYSPHFFDRDAFGLKLRPAPLYSYFYPLDEATLFDLVYAFEDGNMGYFVKGREEDLYPPGIRAVGRAMDIWLGDWLKRQAILAMTDNGEELEIIDLRRVAIKPLQLLDGVDRAALLSLEEAPTPAQAIAALVADGWPEEDARVALRRLVKLRLVLPIDDRLVSLVLTTPVPPVLTAYSSPRGYYDRNPVPEAYRYNFDQAAVPA